LETDGSQTRQIGAIKELSVTLAKYETIGSQPRQFPELSLQWKEEKKRQAMQDYPAHGIRNIPPG
jgi:hypothetical protein